MYFQSKLLGNMAFAGRNVVALRGLSTHTLLRTSRIASRPNIISPLVIAASRGIRPHTTSKPTQEALTPAAANELLVSQRLLRPVAPHLSIYKWQITSVLSSLERITGAILSGSFYLFGVTYLASIPLGWDLSSASLAAAFGAWPVAAKVATKFLVAFPFTLHSFNGIRFLIWDMGKQFSKVQVVRTGLLAVAAATLSAAWLAFL